MCNAVMMSIFPRQPPMNLLHLGDQSRAEIGRGERLDGFRASGSHGRPRATRPTMMPGAVPIAARISSGVPKLSLLPCRTSRGRFGSQQLRDPGLLGPARKVQRERQADDRRRHSCRPPSGRPPGRRHCVRQPGADAAPPTPVPSSQPSAARHASSSFGGGAPTVRPAVRQGCSNRTTVVPSAGKLAASSSRSAAPTPPPAPWPSTRSELGCSAGSTYNLAWPLRCIYRCHRRGHDQISVS